MISKLNLLNKKEIDYFCYLLETLRNLVEQFGSFEYKNLYEKTFLDVGADINSMAIIFLGIKWIGYNPKSYYYKRMKKCERIINRIADKFDINIKDSIKINKTYYDKSNNTKYDFSYTKLSCHHLVENNPEACEEIIVHM